MSFEFNQHDSHLSDFRNPYRFENIFLAIGAVAMLAGGVAAMLHAREFFEIHHDREAVVAATLAMLVLGLAMNLLIQALAQMRFCLGRKCPRGLAGELAVTETGAGEGVGEIMEALRHQAIDFPEPKGALNGILYSLVKDLATAPAEIQAVATQHFHSLIAMGALLASLIVSYVVFAGTPYEGFASWLYLPMSGLSLMTPFIRPERFDLNGGSDGHAETSNGRMSQLIGLAVFSILAPVLIPRFAPHLAIAPMWTPPALLLAGSIVTSGLFFAATLGRLDSAGTTSVSCEQTTVAMNCPPAQLWTAIGRHLQCSWKDGIPNRAYANVSPEVPQGERGSFAGVLLEETQPLRMNTSQLTTWADTLKMPCTRLLVLLGAWGVVMSASCGWAAAKSAEQLTNMSRTEISRSILIVIALAMVATLSFRVGHLLWSRMQFRSRLVWIETSGVFQTSRISVGNTARGLAQSSSTLTRVEDATLRVWVADIVSVAFGKDGNRSIIGMARADHIAKSMADRLVTIAASQSVVATPTANRDLARASMVGRLGKAVRTAKATALPAGCAETIS